MSGKATSVKSGPGAVATLPKKVTLMVLPAGSETETSKVGGIDTPLALLDGANNTGALGGWTA